MITRVRVEVSAKTDQQVRDELLEAAQEVRDIAGGRWEEEPANPQIQTTKDGYWGSFTMRRMDGN